MIKTLNASVNGDGPLKWTSSERMNGDTGSKTLQDEHQGYYRHELLGSRIFESNDAEYCWQNVLDTREVPWLAEHILGNQIVFPPTAYIAMAGESMRQLSNGNLESYSMKNLSITSPLLLISDVKVMIRTRLRSVGIAGETNQWFEIRITSYDGSHWLEHCISKVSPRHGPNSMDLSVPDPKKALQRQVARGYWYDVLEGCGVKYGLAFRGLDEISTAITEHKSVASVSSFEDTTSYFLHPVTMDQCLQITIVAACKGQGQSLTGLSVVTAYENLVVFKGDRTKLRIGGMATKVSSASLSGDVSVVSEQGHLMFRAKGCKTSLVPNERHKCEDKLLSFVRWDTDATYCNLNREIVPSHSHLDPSKILDVIKLLAHKNPKLRILELGRGANELTRLIINALKSQYGELLYLTYTYATTSLDAAFKAKMTFRGTSNLKVLFLDIGQQSPSQNLQAAAYDLIITTDFIFSAKADLSARIDYMKYLIHPLGHLILWDTVTGPSTSKDGKLSSHVRSTLIESGFVFDAGNHYSSEGRKLIAQLEKPLTHPQRVTLVNRDDRHPLVGAIHTSFRDAGIGCDLCTFEGNAPQGQDMILVVDFDEPYLYNITEVSFYHFVNRLSNFKRSMMWVTSATQISCSNPNSAMILGMTRTLRAELRKDITVVEIDDEAATFFSSSNALVKIYQSLNGRTKARTVDPDYEYAIVDGVIKIPRFYWTTRIEEQKALKNFSHSTDHRDPQSLQNNGSSPTSTHFRSDACYLLVGGLGGLGRVISTWMVENGARTILFFSRSAKESPETSPFFDELRAQGCEVLTFAGSVTNLADVKSAVQQATRPVAGIMQMSAIMKDNWLSHMTFTEWDQCVRPKIQGTWNLHRATASANLDFFVLFSSICGLSGQWGQANYNSANTFLDAFVNYRHGQNLAASVVDIGFMGCVGMAVANRTLVEKLTASGYLFLSEQDLIDALSIAIAYSRPGKDPFLNKSHLGLGLRSSKPITDPSTRVVWKKDARMAISHQFGSLRLITDFEARNSLKNAYQGQINTE